MSGAFSSKKEKTAQTQRAQSDPWDVTIPALKDIVGQVQGLIGGDYGVTPDQQAAADQIKDNVSGGNPYAPQIDELAGDLFGTQSNSGMVNDEFADFKTRLTPTADGNNLDLMNNPNLQAMLQQVTDDAQNRISASFAAGGRTGSGAEQTAVARGITQAQLPLLLNQYNTELGRTDAATRDLFAGGANAAGQMTALDSAANAERAKGIEVGQQALAAENYGPEAILNLEEQMKNLPLEYLAKLSSILFPAAQLGQQSTGSAEGKSKSSGFSIGLDLLK